MGGRLEGRKRKGDFSSKKKKNEKKSQELSKPAPKQLFILGTLTAESLLSRRNADREDKEREGKWKKREMEGWEMKESNACCVQTKLQSELLTTCN